jgi:hypothetical protein
MKKVFIELIYSCIRERYESSLASDDAFVCNEGESFCRENVPRKEKRRCALAVACRDYEKKKRVFSECVMQIDDVCFINASEAISQFLYDGLLRYGRDAVGQSVVRKSFTSAILSKDDFPGMLKCFFCPPAFWVKIMR